MLKENDLEKIKRYLDGQADDSEKVWVESQFLNGEENYSFKNLLKNDWDLMLRDPSTAGIDLNPLLDRVHHIIRKNETLKRQKPLYKFIQIYRKTAAILLLPLLIAGALVYIYSDNHGKTISDRQVSSTIYAPLGARISFSLPDGTSGMLNSGSKLSYSLPFNNNRKIKLEGEAWLDVSSDEDHPFEISTGNSTVKVLGTSFNVNAYPTENYVEIVLQHGKLKFMDNKGAENVTLLPSERLIYKNGKIDFSNTDPAKYFAWTEGKLVFRGDPMSEVARRIERWYNVKIELADKELEQYSFRATFEDEKLEDVLRLLSLTSPIRYKIKPQEMTQDGTYKKEEVTIYLK